MTNFAVVINGVPGSGKTTLCSSLQRELGVPLISKDAVKEALADLVVAQLPTSDLGAVASEVLWKLAGLISGPVIVESFWLAGRDDAFFADGLRAGGVQDGVEVWCHAPVGVMRKRFQERPRHFAHQDSGRLSEWEVFARDARPISTFPLLRVQTGTPVDIEKLAETIRPRMMR